jgi:predicted ATPase
MSDPTFVTRVLLRNYRSIEACELHLGPLTFLVGPNGSGKSNFLDALRLVADSLNSSLDHALRERGGLNEVRRRSSGHPTHFAIRLDLLLPDQRAARYSFEVGARRGGEFVVKREECSVGNDHYVVREGAVDAPPNVVMPPASADRLYLTNAAGLPQFRPIFDALSLMGFYNVNPEKVRELQPPDKGDLLTRDARNLASVIARLDREEHRATKARITEYLMQVVPGIVGFDTKRVGHMETIELRQLVAGSNDAWRFPAINMSDGTLRVLAILVALFQSGADQRVRLVGLEEPETALHPAAAATLRDCILEASRTVQVIVTSHSAELLDADHVEVEMLRAVEATGGRTIIAPVDEASRSAVRDRLYTPGELLRAGQLAPDTSALVSPGQLRLFGDDAA